MALSEVLALRRRWTALDRRPPLRGNGKHKKNSKQQSTCGRRRVRAAGGLMGVMKVTPCGCDRNFRGVAAPGCQKPLLPSSGGKIDLNTLKQQSTDGGKRAGAHMAAQGSRKQPITPSFSFLPGGDPGGCFRLPKHPPGSKKQETNTHTTINYLRETRGSSRTTVRGIKIEKSNKIDYKALT